LVKTNTKVVERDFVTVVKKKGAPNAAQALSVVAQKRTQKVEGCETKKRGRELPNGWLWGNAAERKKV